jgi:hypothetical protein
MKTVYRLIVQKYFVIRSNLRSCFLQAKTSSYFCRIFYLMKILTRHVVYIESNIEASTCNKFKQKINDYLVVWVVVVLIVQDGKRMHSILFSPVFYLTVIYLFHLSSLTAQVCEKSYWTFKSVYKFSLLRPSEKFLILRSNWRIFFKYPHFKTNRALNKNSNFLVIFQ